MSDNRYPELSFILDSGRKVKVNALIWEPSFPEVIVVGKRKQLEIVRNRFRCSDVVGARNPLIHNWDQTAEIDPFPNSVITAQLSSAPMSNEAITSELVVVFFVEHTANSSFEAILQSNLHDLSWENHAEDVMDQGASFNEDIYSEKALH